MGKFPCDTAPNYVLTFWMRFDFTGNSEGYRNLFHVGKPDAMYPKSPAVYQYPSNAAFPSSRLSFVFSTDVDPDFKCDPEPELVLGEWTFIVVSVQHNATQIFYDSELVCSAETQGTIHSELPFPLHTWILMLCGNSSRKHFGGKDSDVRRPISRASVGQDPVRIPHFRLMSARAFTPCFVPSGNSCTIRTTSIQGQRDS